MLQPRTNDAAARSEHIQRLIAQLRSSDGMARDLACQQLVQIGRSAVTPLIEALRDHDQRVRLEAIGVLGEIGDPAAAPELIRCMSEDERFANRWLAAESLIALKREGVIPLLRALERASWGDVWLREGAHHVLRSLLGTALGPAIAPILPAIDGPELGLTTPLAAFNALNKLS